MIEEAFLRDLDRNDLRVHRPYSFESFALAEDSTETYPVTVSLVKGPSEEGGKDGGEISQIKCKYLVGCDGGRSAVRELLMKEHKFVMTGEYVDTLWGALDAGEWAFLFFGTMVHAPNIHSLVGHRSRHFRLPRSPQDRCHSQCQVGIVSSIGI